MARKPISTSLNLTALRNSRIIFDKGEEGIFIPFRKNGVNKIITKKEEQRAYLYLFHNPYDDKFGNNYIVSRNRNEAETENNAFTETLGNAKEVGGSMNVTPDVEDEQERDYSRNRKNTKKEDDSPF